MPTKGFGDWERPEPAEAATEVGAEEPQDDFSFFRGLLLACAATSVCFFLAGVIVGLVP